MKNIFPSLSYDFFNHDLPIKTVRKKPLNCDTEKSQNERYVHLDSLYARDLNFRSTNLM